VSEISVALICASCSHDWVADLSQEENFRPVERGGRPARIYRVACPICGAVLLVEVRPGESDD
jgi:hypothetical protein